MRNRITAILLAVAVAIALAGLGACKPIKDIAGVADIIVQDLPTAADTLTTLVEITHAIDGAMSRGETELTFNAADISEGELKRIGENLSTFWGMPVSYSVNNEFKGIEGIVPGKSADVKNITNKFRLSDNYYVYSHVQSKAPIPEDRPLAQEIAGALPSIAAEVFSGPKTSDYDEALAIHDWLVANVNYDESRPDLDGENGTYGAMVLRRTMCQGYAEAFELLVRCYTDIDVVQIVGDALNYSTSGTWGGHAWNAVKLGGAWYQIDVTFDDPVGDAPGRVSHFYFGQTDAVMSNNHRWEREYFPVSDAADFLYFRQSGLLAGNWEVFENIITEQLTEAPIEKYEIAIMGDAITPENIQFVYGIRSELDEVHWSEQLWNDIHVYSLEFIYP